MVLEKTVYLSRSLCCQRVLSVTCLLEILTVAVLWTLSNNLGRKSDVEFYLGSDCMAFEKWYSEDWNIFSTLKYIKREIRYLFPYLQNNLLKLDLRALGWLNLLRGYILLWVSKNRLFLYFLNGNPAHSFKDMSVFVRRF